MSRSPLVPLMVVAAGLASLTLAAGDGSECASGDISQDCDIPGDLMVAQGHTMAIEGATVRFTGTGTFTVAGSLELTDATIDVVDGAELAIRFLAGSDVQVQDSAITGYASLQVAGDFSVDNLTLETPGTALDAEASMVLRDVAITARDGVHVAANTSLELVGGMITASRDAVVAADGASVRFEDTVLLGGSVDLEGTALFKESFHVLLNVSAGGTGDVDAAFRDAAGVVQASGAVTPDEPEPFLLPGQVRTAAGTATFSPYFVSVVQGSSAGHALLDLVQPGQELDVEVPDDPDADEPEWPVSEPLRHDGAFPGFSGDGDVRIAWEAADDTMDGLKANRAVDHYELFVGGVKTTETRDTAFLLEGLDPGSYMVRVDAVDLVGNRNESNPVQILVDTVAPTLSIETDPAPSALGAHAGPVDVQVTAEDADSGLRALRWRIGGGVSTQVDLCADDDDPCTSQTFQVELDGPGVHRLHVVAQDQAGTKTETVHNITIDTSPPLFIASIEPDLPAGAWHREPPSLHVNTTEPGPSGPGQVRWRLGDGPWQNHSAPAVLEAVGEHTVRIEVTDGAGNVARAQLRHALDPDAPALAVDTTGPVGLAEWFTGPTNATATASDDLSGVGRLEYRLGTGAWRPFVEEVSLQEDGVHDVTFRAVDAAGNEALQHLDVSIDSQPPRPPGVEWSVLADGRIRADWSRAPPFDAASGIAALRIERGEDTHDVPATALGHVLIGLPAAEHALRVVATDAAGHEAATQWRTVRGGNGTAAASATDARGTVLVSPDPSLQRGDLLEVRYHVDGSLVSSKAGPPYEFRWDTRSLANGPHQLLIVAVDAEGIHHEELRTFNVRNGYVAALADGAWAAAAAVGVAIGSAAAAVNGLRSWRREVVA